MICCLAPWLLLAELAFGVKDAVHGELPPESNQSGSIDNAQVRSDRYGDPLPAAVRARMGTMRLRPASLAPSLAFSADCKILYSTGFRGIFAWEVSTGRLLHKLAAPEDDVRSLTLAANDSLLAALCGEKLIRLWQPATGKFVGSLPADSARVLAISLDGTTLAAGPVNRLVQLWDVASHRRRRQFEPPSQHLFWLRFAGNSRGLLLVGSDSMAGSWDVAPCARASPSNAKTGWSAEVWASCAACTRNGKLLATASSTQRPYAIQVWDTATGTELRTFPARDPEVTALAFAPDDRALAVGYLDGSLRLLDAGSGKELRHLQTRGQAIREVVFSPDGKLLAWAGWNGPIHLWEIATGQRLLPFGGHQGPVDLVAFSPDGKLLATGGPNDPSVRLWDSASGKLLHQVSGSPASVHCLTFSVDGKSVVSGHGDGRIYFWDVNSGRQLRLFTVPPYQQRRGVYNVDALNLSADGLRLTAVCQDRFDSHGWGFTLIDQWDVATGKILSRHAEHGSPHFERSSVQIAPEGQSVVLPDQDGLCVRHLAMGKEVYRLRDARAHATLLAWSAHGRILALGRREHRDDRGGGTARYQVQFTEPATGRALFDIQVDGLVEALAFSPDDTIFATASPDAISLWEMATGRELHRLPGPGMPVNGMVFAQDGRTLATGSGDGTALVWNLEPPRWHGKAARDLNTMDLASLWDELGAKDGTRAYQAAWMLAAAAPEKVCSFLKAVLPPAVEQDPNHLRRLLADLDSNRFVVREHASKELGLLGSEAEPALRQALADHPSVEARRRIDALLAAPVLVRQPDKIRRLRAIHVLGQIGTAQARRILEILIGGAALAPDTIAAKAAFERLAGR